ncbi:hypothetical protein GQX73_g2823 [Xylaria multiplex]|uniref:Rhodopsin domain-containing protein n=1 Tax=Xylaria multiplex TaxID=323545 RepID=A0A7C8ITT5_9PEZI|nr:hypothetical protein GQX73_g2823 [Xylaria multiplex]
MSLLTHPPLDYSNSGPGIVISGSVVGFITTVVVALRYWARRLTRQEFKLDDWLCVAALLFQHALMAASAVVAINGGLGRDVRLVLLENPNSVVVLLQARVQTTVVGEIAYTFSSPLIKLSLLALYRRIFPTRVVQIGTQIIGIACIASFIPTFILDFTQCRPLRAFWLVELQTLPTTKCINLFQFLFANAIVNSIIDFSALALPIHEVLKLQITTRQKINVALVFLLGGVAFAAALVRTISTAQLQQGVTNFSKQFVVPTIATVVEIYVAIIGACLPTLMPIYRKLRYGSPLRAHTNAMFQATPANWNSSGRVVQPKRSGNRNDLFHRLHETDDGLSPIVYHGDHRVKASGSRTESDTPFSDAESYPLEGLVVTRDIIWTETNSYNYHSPS